MILHNAPIGHFLIWLAQGWRLSHHGGQPAYQGTHHGRHGVLLWQPINDEERAIVPFRYGSVCSGIEAASVAWKPLGWRCSFMSEIAPFPRAVLSHRFPDVPLRGDFTEIEAGDHEPIDLLVGGTPCQSFSVAGLRGGLADDRGNLALQFLRLADRLRPRWLLWENVPGVLSSGGGRDFGSILGGLAELGYGFAYRVLDAQYVRVDGFARAVPQRRRRVFVVGHLGDWRPAAAVLFERASLSGHPAPRREAGAPVAALTANGVGTCGADDNQGQAGHLIGSVAPSLESGANRTGGIRPPGTTVDTAETLVAHALRSTGFDASEDGTGRGTPLVPVAFNTTQITSAANYSNPQPGDPCHPLAAAAHAPAIAFTCKDSGQDAGLDVAPTLRAMNAAAGGAPNGGGQVAVAFNITPSNSNKDFNAREARYAQALTAGGNAPSARGGDLVTFPAAHNYAVRRLTPRECERLQGFPDDWTLVPYRGKSAADGPRYAAIGNSMAVNVMRWIGQRIQEQRAIVEAARKGEEE